MSAVAHPVVRRTGAFANGLLTALILVVVLGPIAWGLATSLKTEVESVAVPPTLLPNAATLQNYFNVFTSASFLLDLWNSVAYAVGAVLLSLLVGIPAGYAAARLQFPGKRTIMLAILATSMVPGVALSIGPEH